PTAPHPLPSTPLCRSVDRRGVLERGGDPLVQSHPLDRCHLGKQRLPHERVVEAELAICFLDDDPGPPRFVDLVDQVTFEHLLDEDRKSTRRTPVTSLP